MATHSSVLAWEIPWTEEPYGLQYMGSQRARWLSNFLVTSSINYLRQKPLEWYQRHLYIYFASHVQIRKYCWFYCPNILRIRQLISTYIVNTWSRQPLSLIWSTSCQLCLFKTITQIISLFKMFPIVSLLSFKKGIKILRLVCTISIFHHIFCGLLHSLLYNYVGTFAVPTKHLTASC